MDALLDTLQNITIGGRVSYLEEERDLASDQPEEPSLVEGREHADGAAEDAHQEVGGAEVQQQDVADDALVPDGGGDEGVGQESHGENQSV